MPTQRYNPEASRDASRKAARDTEGAIGKELSKMSAREKEVLRKAVKELDEMEEVIAVAEVEHFGEKITIPEKMTIPQAIEVLDRRLHYLEEEVTMIEDFDSFPWDGANALRCVLTEMYGWAPSGNGSPSIKVDIDYGKSIYVPWGSFEIPNSSARLHCDVHYNGKRFIFRVLCTVRRKDEETIKQVFANTREYLKTDSIYRGKAIKMRFLDDDGDRLAMPSPEFIDLSKVDPAQLIYPDVIHDAVETNLFTPIERVEDCLSNGLPIKRAVLLGGTYGVGKTLAAMVAAKKSVDNGITFLYVPRADELKMALEFAKQYQSPACTIFCEDIDRVTSGDRSISMDDLLNIMDGVDSKHNHFVMVLTTNALEAINPAMIRPGRLDAVIEVLPPDASAAERLLRHYAGDALAPDTDLTAAAEALVGSIPAVIAEVVQRAKLAELKRLPKGMKISGLSDVSILEASLTMKNQTDLMQRLINAGKKTPVPLEQALKALVRQAMDDEDEEQDA